MTTWSCLADPPTEYDSTGVLTTAWSNLLDVRLVTAATGAPSGNAPCSEPGLRNEELDQSSVQTTTPLPKPPMEVAQPPKPSASKPEKHFPGMETLSVAREAVQRGGLGPPQRSTALPTPLQPSASGIAGKLPPVEAEY